jgi:hypothetical protein
MGVDRGKTTPFGVPQGVPPTFDVCVSTINLFLRGAFGNKTLTTGYVVIRGSDMMASRGSIDEDVARTQPPL